MTNRLQNIFNYILWLNAKRKRIEIKAEYKCRKLNWKKRRKKKKSRESAIKLYCCIATKIEQRKMYTRWFGMFSSNQRSIEVISGAVSIELEWEPNWFRAKILFFFARGNRIYRAPHHTLVNVFGINFIANFLLHPLPVIELFVLWVILTKG